MVGAALLPCSIFWVCCSAASVSFSICRIFEAIVGRASRRNVEMSFNAWRISLKALVRDSISSWAPAACFWMATPWVRSWQRSVDETVCGLVDRCYLIEDDLLIGKAQGNGNGNGQGADRHIHGPVHPLDQFLIVTDEKINGQDSLPVGRKLLLQINNALAKGEEQFFLNESPSGIIRYHLPAPAHRKDAGQ